jgi:hypothetical protein
MTSLFYRLVFSINQYFHWINMAENDVGIWQGVAMDSLNYCFNPPCPTLLCPAGGQPWNGLMGVSRVPAPMAGGPWPSSTPLDTRRRTPLENEQISERVSEKVGRRWKNRSCRRHFYGRMFCDLFAWRRFQFPIPLLKQNDGKRERVENDIIDKYHLKYVNFLVWTVLAQVFLLVFRCKKSDHLQSRCRF